MIPLIGLAAAVVPAIVDALAGPRAAQVTRAITTAATEIAGVSDPRAADQAIAADPDKMIAYRTRVAEIAVEDKKVDLEALKAKLGDTANARELTSKTSMIAWAQVIFGAVIVGVIAINALAPLFTSRVFSIDPFLATVFGTVMGFFYGNSTASNAANSDRSALAAVASTLRGSQQQQPTAISTTGDVVVGGSSQEGSAQAFIRTPSAPGTTADDLNNQELSRLGSRVASAPGTTADDLNQQEIERPRRRVPAGSSVTPSPLPRVQDASRFDECVALILQEEGGYADHPKDPGGATNMGITHKTLAAYRGRLVTKQDVRALTVDEAREIYRENYWKPMQCDYMPAGVDLMSFNLCVNAGQGRATRILQEVAGAAIDGKMGPLTLAAVRGNEAADLIRRFAARQMAFYRSLDGWDTFGGGWAKRTDRVKVKALAMAGAV